MRADHGNRRTQFVSFSGIDGAGKSTQIRLFCARIETAGLSYSLVNFWDDVARFKFLREGASRVVFNGDRGVGTPEAPISRRDKNVRSWAMTALRLCIYFADAVSTRSMMKRALRSKADILIFDRFIYDELANLNLENPAIRIYARMIARFVPKLEISFLLDADPAEALARKPEYPLEFLQFSRKSYFALNEIIGCMTIVAPMPVREVEQQIQNRAEAALTIALVHQTSDRGQPLPETVLQ